MTDVLSRSLPPPRNWQDFEHLAYDLFRRLWNSDDTELHGRSGQAQSGVDVFGTDYKSRDGTPRFVGVQCKGKDAEYGHALTEKELRAEVEKALTFQPPLDLFILATTAPNDVSLQAVARSLTAEHRKTGKFEVQVKGWDTLRLLITDYPAVVAKHFKDFAPVDIVSEISELRAENALAHQQTFTMLLQHRQMVEVIRDGNGDGDPLAQSVMVVADQIGDGNPTAALKALERMLKENEHTASALARFRIHANIGNAQLALGCEAEAIAAFERSHAVNPDYPNARATLALAKALQGRKEEALALAKSALADDPSLRRAAGIIIDLMPRGTPLAEVEAALTPDLLEHFEIKIGLSIRSHHEGDFAAALRFAEEAQQLKPDDWRTISSVAEALLGPLASQDIIAVTGILDAAMEAALDRAIVLNRKAWAILAAQDSSYPGRHVAANLVSQLLLTGDDAGAWVVLDQALIHNPDYGPLLQRAAQRSAGEGDWESARCMIGKIPTDQRVFEDALMLMQCSLHLKDRKAASDLVPELARLAKLPDQIEYAAGLAVDADLLAGADPKTVIEAALAAHPESIILRSILLESEQHDVDIKARLVEEVAAFADDRLSPRARVLAAEAMIDAGEFSKAADLYEPLHSTRDSPALYRRLQCLHFAERREEARRLYESVPVAVRHKERFARLGIAIYEQAGLLKPAVRLLDEQLASTDRLGDRLRWLQLLVRLGESRHIEWLRQVPADIDGSARELAVLAQFVDKLLGGDAKALELGYRALRAGYSDVNVHIGFACGLFFQGLVRRQGLTAPTSVEVGAGVILVDDASGDVLHFIIEPRACPATERGELAPDHPVAKELIGRAVGDIVTIRKMGPVDLSYRIAEIQNGHVFAFQRTLREFGKLFPGHPAIGMVKIDDAKAPDERFEQVFAMVRDRAEQARNLEEVYETGPMPLFLLARLSGSNLFDLWEAFRARDGKYLKVAIGFGQEFEQGQSAAGAGLVLLDPLVIYAWVRLGLADMMLGVRDKLAVVQSSIDMLRQLHAEREDQRGQSFGTMGWDGEHYHMSEATPEVIEQRIADADAAAQFASQLVLVPAESAQSLRSDVAHLLEGTHPAFIDTLLAGMNPKRGLLTDCLGMRAIAQECGIPCTWTQTFLQVQVRSGSLRPSDYQTGLNALIASHYDFTQLGHAEILAELQASGWTISSQLQRFAAAMARPNVDRESVAGVLAELAMESRFRETDAALVAAFHIAFVQALAEAGLKEETAPIYQRVLARLHNGFFRRLIQRHYRAMLQRTTSHTPPDVLASELRETATRLTRGTWQILSDGGLYIDSG